jgi:cytoskeletal protein CcmA (bactofilin family)
MTVIGTSLVITGQVTSQEDVAIQGRLVGKISVEKGALLIAQSANVEAEAQVARLTVHGGFSGDIEATERVELSQTANVSGTLIAPAVVLHDGAVFNGSIETLGSKKGAAEPRLAKAS